MDVFDFSNDQIITFYKKIIRFKPKYIYGYPSAIFTFFDKLLKIKSYDISKIKLNAIITTGEVLHSYQRTFLEEILNCPVVNEYGSCETGPITFECKNRNIHLMADNLYIEIINNGRAAKANETGETIITELFNYVNPLIRYKLGDRIKLKEILNYNCPCSRNLPVIEKVKGRTSEIVKLPNDKIIHSEIFDYISDKLLESNGGIKQYKVTQQNIGEFHYDIVPSGHFSDKTLELLRTLIQEYLGSETHLTVNIVENIPVTESGKLRYFESKI
jgi:phenylacetate-CoA ligase